MFYVERFFEGWELLIIAGITLIGGSILFALTGFIRISKGRVGVIERVGTYIGTYKNGLYYFAPILYRRVGYYRVGEIKQRIQIGRKEYFVKYEIENFKTFHYIGKHDVKGVVNASLNEPTKDLSKLLIERFNIIGARFISLEIIKR